MVNVFGLLKESRYLPDRRDLNRSFPGSKRGSLAAQIAHLFFTEIVNRCELGVDIHTGSGGRANLPQIRCDANEPATLRYAEIFGAPVIVHSILRDGSLRAAVRASGIRVLLYEAGEALRFDRDAIDTGVAGVLRVMKALEMIADAPAAPRMPPLRTERSSWIRASRSGFCQMSVELGARIRAGEEVAQLFDAMGGPSVSLRARARRGRDRQPQPCAGPPWRRRRPHRRDRAYLARRRRVRWTPPTQR